MASPSDNQANLEGIINALQLINPKTKCATCVGRTGRGRRCQAKIFSGNLDASKAAIPRLSRSEVTVKEVSATLDIVAGLSLCEGQHRHQAYQTRERWLLVVTPYVVVSRVGSSEPSAQDKQSRLKNARRLEQKQKKREAKEKDGQAREEAEATRREETLRQAASERIERVRAAQEAEERRLRDEANEARRAEALRQAAKDRAARVRVKRERETKAKAESLQCEKEQAVKAEAERLAREREVRQAADEARRAEALRQAAIAKEERAKLKREREERERLRAQAEKEEKESQEAKSRAHERRARELKEAREPKTTSPEEAFALYDEAWSKAHELGANPDEATIWTLKLCLPPMAHSADVRRKARGSCLRLAI